MKNAQMAEKTNMTKLIQSLIMRFNDPREIVRSEIESFFVQLSFVSVHLSHTNYTLEHENQKLGPEFVAAVRHFPH
jgi:hypothetical protein